MLQCGHAYFNLSYLYYLKLDARAIMYAEKTMELYIKYPLTSNTDIADIKMLFVLAKSWINEVIIENDLISTWDYIKKLEFQLLNQDIIVDYYLLLYSFFKCKKGPRFEELEKEINSLSERKLKKMQSASILGIYPYLDKINNNES